MEVLNEPLGRSDAAPGQVFHLEHTPVLPRRQEERIEIWVSGMQDWEPWTEVEDFGESGLEDKHYTWIAAVVRSVLDLRFANGMVPYIDMGQYHRVALIFASRATAMAEALRAMCDLGQLPKLKIPLRTLIMSQIGSQLWAG